MPRRTAQLFLGPTRDRLPTEATPDTDLAPPPLAISPPRPPPPPPRSLLRRSQTRLPRGVSRGFPSNHDYRGLGRDQGAPRCTSHWLPGPLPLPLNARILRALSYIQTRQPKAILDGVHEQDDAFRTLLWNTVVSLIFLIFHFASSLLARFVPFRHRLFVHIYRSAVATLPTFYFSLRTSLPRFFFFSRFFQPSNSKLFSSAKRWRVFHDFFNSIIRSHDFSFVFHQMNRLRISCPSFEIFTQFHFVDFSIQLSTRRENEFSYVQKYDLVLLFCTICRIVGLHWSFVLNGSTLKKTRDYVRRIVSRECGPRSRTERDI